MKYFIPVVAASVLIACISCESGSGTVNGDRTSSGLKIAYVNGDSILLKYEEFREASQGLNAKQAAAEQKLQVKMEELDKQVSAYQRRAQGGTMSPKEMQAEEQRLGGMQQELRMESDQLSKELMADMEEINARLQKIVKDKLREIKEAEGYDFILNSMEGGPILIADEKHNITDRVIRELNAMKGNPIEDTSGQAE